MKVGNLNNATGTVAVTGERKPAASPAQAKATAAGSAPASATVELSATASLLVAQPDDPAFDAAKVDRIAQAIKDGKFKVNPEAIADKLIANAQELLGRSGGTH